MYDQYQMAKVRQLAVAPEALTFSAKTGQGQFTSYLLYGCQRSAVTKTMIENGRLVQKQLVKFRVHQADLTAAAAPAPKNHDLVTDAAGLTYVVHGVTPELRGQVYVLNDCQLNPT